MLEPDNAPQSAVVEEDGQWIAFVQVLEGIKAGERVVTKGAYAIRLSSISGVIPAHGHAH